MASRAWTMGEACAWRDAAIADGWSAEPTYPMHEPAERAVTLKRDGFVATIVTRPKEPTQIKEWTNVNVWGPDGLAAIVPVPYSWDALQDSLRRCALCGKEGAVVRLNFALRVCPDCRKAKVDKYEYHGWTE